MKVAFHPNFIRIFKKLPVALQEEIRQKISLFEQDQANISLKNHKLHGKLKNYYSFSVNYSYRILYKKHGKIVVLAEIGTHDMYK